MTFFHCDNLFKTINVIMCFSCLLTKMSHFTYKKGEICIQMGKDFLRNFKDLCTCIEMPHRSGKFYFYESLSNTHRKM